MSDILPFDNDAERAVIGAAMHEPETFRQLAALVNADDFHTEKHRRIWSAMLSLYEAGVRISPVMVAAKIRDAGQLDSVGGISYISTIDDGLGSLMGGDAYAQRVREKSVLRQTITACRKLIGDCQSSGDSREVLQRGEKLLRDLNAASSQDRRLVKAGQIIKDCGGLDLFLKGTQADVPTPWATINESLAGGFRRGEMIVLAAGTGVGKTAAASQIAGHASVVHGVPTAVFSLEMSKRDVLLRAAITRSGVDGSCVRSNRMNREQRRALHQALADLDQAPIWFDDTAAATVSAIHAALRSLGEKFGLVVVDYLQLVEALGKYGSREQEVSSVGRGLKLLASDFDVPVIALSQLNAESDDFEEPRLRNLRESKAIGQHANTVMFAWRKEAPQPGVPFVRAGMSIGKQRNGPQGVKVNMLYHAAELRFVEEMESYA